MMLTPSNWVTRHAEAIPVGATVLDHACGSGRHARWLATRGWRVVAVDRDEAAIAGLQALDGIEAWVTDLEAPHWPLAGRQFDAVVVTNYLYRPHFDALLASVAPGGILIYETFMLGNEAFGKPSNPDFLLRPDELRERLADGFSLIAFEQGPSTSPKPAVMQRAAACKLAIGA